jgi:hypothetical protein
MLVVVIAGLIGSASARVEIDRTGDRAVTCSNQINENESGIKVFDGQTGTKWLTGGGSTTGWVALDFDFDLAYVVDNYSITSANDAPDRTCKDWALQGSNDGETWVDVDVRTGEANWSTFERRDYTAANTTAYKMYRLNVTANNGSGNLMGFSELELRSGDEIVNDAEGTITASSSQADNGWVAEVPDAAFDNTGYTRWTSNGSPETPGWIGYQFPNGEAYAINGYILQTYGDIDGREVDSCELQGSNNGTDWDVLDTRTNINWTTANEAKIFEFTNTTVYSYIRLLITQCHNINNGYCEIAELQLLTIDDVPAVLNLAPGGNVSVNAEPLVLTWETARESENATYTVSFGTDPNTYSFVESGITDKSFTVPESAITDDSIYYWKVDIVEGGETFSGPTERFRVLRQAKKVLEWTMDSFAGGTVYGYEVPIVDVVTYASSQESNDKVPNDTLGAGLSIDVQDPTTGGLTHNANASNMWICNPDQAGTVWIKYEFAEANALGTMLIWNHNVGDPWLSELNRGMRNVQIYTASETGISGADPNLWTHFADVEIPIGTGNPAATYSLAVPFNGLTAKSVLIRAADVNSNWGADRNFHALSEVRFGKYNQFAESYVVPDASGNGNDGGTYVDAQLVTEDAISGSAIEFTGNDQVFMYRDALGSAETLPLGNADLCSTSWSMNMFVKLNEMPNDLNTIMAFGGFEAGTGRFVSKFANGIHFWGGNGVDGDSGVPYDTGRWQMISATYDSSTLRLYKNALQIYEGPAALNEAPARVNLSGQNNWGPSKVKGLMDEFTIYEGVLSDTDLIALKSIMPTQGAALNPYPADGATDVISDTILSWEAPLDVEAPTYDVYLGEGISSLALVASGLAETELDASSLGLLNGTTYYWYVATSGGDDSSIWNFTTLAEEDAATTILAWDFETPIEYAHTYEAAVQDVIATASSQEQDSRSPDRTVNDAGIQTDPFTADETALTHVNNAEAMWISQPNNTDTPWIQYEFDQSYPIGSILIWNHNVGDPWLNELDRGMRNVNIYYTEVYDEDPNNWTNAGAYEIPMGTGDAAATYSLKVDLGGAMAKYVLIEAASVNSNWGAGNNLHALSEVRFGIYGTTDTSFVVDDVTGNGNVGIPYNTPKLVPGLAGSQAVELENPGMAGLHDYINADITNQGVLPLSGSDKWSMNFYTYLPQDIPSPTLLAGFGGQDTATGRWIGRFNGVHMWGGHNVDVASTSQYRRGHWQMVTCTYNGDEMKLFHDGVEVAAGYPNFIDAPAFVSLAGQVPWDNLFNGVIDDFTFYRGVLTRTEIATLAEAIPAEGDMNVDGTVNAIDLPIFAAEWLAADDCNQVADFTGDCDVTIEDYAVFGSSWVASLLID